MAVVGGAIALAASGGGGSSGSDNDSSDDEPKPEPDACANINCGVYGVCSAGTCHCYAGYTGNRCEVPPSGPTGDETDPNTWRTAEFKKGNFLDQIKAEYAYARGYTGYVTQETVDESGNTLEKVRVGVLDYGTDINHPDLIANIAKDENGNSYGYNFDYGPCRNGDKTNCYSWKERSGSTSRVTVIFYDENSKEIELGWTNDGTWTDSKGNTYATSSVFGHGMVDLDKATQPLGDLTLASENSVNGAKVSVKATRLALPRLINASVAERLPVVVAGLDDYNRAFPVVTSAVIRRAGRSSESFKRSFRSFMHQNKVQTAGLKDKMSFSFSSSLTDDNLLGMGTLDMYYAFSDRSSIRFSYRSDTIAEEASFNQVLMNPFVDMTDAYSLTHRFDLNKKVSLSFGAALGKNGFFEGDEDAGEEFNRSMSAFQTEMAWRPFSKMTLKAVGGVISEKDAALGLNGTGAFETGSTHTVFYGAVAEYNPLSTLTLSAAYYYGRSMVPRTNSLVSLNRVVSDSFALDVRYRMEKRMAGIQLSSPLRIRRGTASFDLPVGRDAYTDTIYRERFDVSLKPRAREYNFGVYYTQEDDSFEWRYELGTRIHPDHMDGVKPDYRALFGLVWRY